MSVHFRTFGDEGTATLLRKNSEEIFTREEPAIAKYARTVNGPQTLADEIATEQRQLAGFDIMNPRMFNSEYNPNNINGQNSDDPNSEKEKRKRMQLIQSALIAAEIDLSFDNVVRFLDRTIEFNRSLLNTSEMFVAVREDQMLHVRNGVRIDPADDPDNLYLVQTREERLAYEDSIQACTGFLSQEEVTVVDGQLVNIDAYNGVQSLLVDIERREDILARVESGELAPADLDPDLVEEMRSRDIEPEAPSATPLALDQGSLLPPQAPAVRPAPAPSFTPSF